MQFIKGTGHFDFMGFRRIGVAISLAMVLVSAYAIGTGGLALGVDFTGGLMIEVRYPTAAHPAAVREVLVAAGKEDVQVQNFGSASEVLIRLAPSEASADAVSEEVMNILSAAEPGVELRDRYFVGAQVGEELTEQGGLAMLFAMGMILLYVAFRFQLKFSLGAIAALVHDTIIVIGFFAITRADFDLSVLAAVLAVIGYSLNDTIVVFDRIRENFHVMRKASSVDVMNTSINQTMSRTIITGATTLMVLFALFFLGGEVIHGFATALIVGVIVGTYSSIFVASPVTLYLGATRDDFIVPKDEAQPDSHP
jgi:preprotein translocase subunit SecF